MSDRWKKLSMTSGIVTGTLIALVTVVTLAPATQGCEDDPLNALCCTEFSVGADLSNVDFEVDAEYEGRYNAFAQAASDVGATAAAAVNDVTFACRNIAIALGADPNDASVADKTGNDAATAWCALAKATFEGNAAVEAAADWDVQYQPPTCSASLDAHAECQGSCQAEASCTEPDISVRCEEGKLVVQCEGECKGSCRGSATASAKCEGSCDATCEGSCTASGGADVNCEGSCSGNCDGTCNGSNINGACNGKCVGTCDATCEMSAGADVQCNGRCDGRCTGTCEFAADADFECDGECTAGCEGDFKAPTCEGEIQPPVCEASADCQASCEASVEATAECTPPELVITASVDVALQAELDVVVTALKTHLPELLVVADARGQAFVDSISSLSSNGSAFIEGSVSSAKGVACGAAITSTVVSATASAEAALSASLDLKGAVIPET